MITVTFPHLYLLCDVHQTRRKVSDLSASRLKVSFDLIKLGLIEVTEEGYCYTTEQGNILVAQMAHTIPRTPAV